MTGKNEREQPPSRISVDEIGTCNRCEGNLFFAPGDGEITCGDCGFVQMEEGLKSDNHGFFMVPRPLIVTGAEGMGKNALSDVIGGFNSEASEKGSHGGDRRASSNHNGNIVDHSYKRISHWREVQNQNRGEGGEVDEVTIAEIAKFLTEKGVNPKEIDVETMMNILCYLGLQHLYEHTVQIVSRVCRRMVEWVREEDQAELNAMFHSAMQAWVNAPLTVRKTHPKKSARSSFVNYRDFTRRCLKYKGLPHWVNIKGITTPGKIRELNVIWEYFGKYCGWKDWEKGLMPIQKRVRKNQFKRVDPEKKERRGRKKIISNSACKSSNL